MMAVLVVVATACTRGSTSVAKHSPSSSPASTTVSWKGCGSGFQCGTLTVPLDYSKPSGDTIKLALIRKPATDTANRIGSHHGGRYFDPHTR